MVLEAGVPSVNQQMEKAMSGVMAEIDRILDAYLDGFLDAWERDRLIEVELECEVDAVAAEDDKANGPFTESA